MNQKAEISPPINPKNFNCKLYKGWELFEKLLERKHDTNYYWKNRKGVRFPVRSHDELGDAITYWGKVVKIYGEDKNQSETSRNVSEERDRSRDVMICRADPELWEPSSESEVSSAEDEDHGPRRRRHPVRRHGRRLARRRDHGERHVEYRGIREISPRSSDLCEDDKNKVEEHQHHQNRQ